MHIGVDELPGLQVFDANGRAIGRVIAALVDMETWVVDTLRVAVARAAAADLYIVWPGWRFWQRPTIDVATGQINAAGDAIILRVSLAELREATPPTAGEHAAMH
jgi:sporulation protein YlmC with PRC-barrel domain